MQLPSLNKDIYKVIISFIPYEKKNWLNLRLVNKELLAVCKKYQDCSINESYSIRWAYDNDHINVFKELLEDTRIDVRVWNDYLLLNSIKDNRIEYTKLLLNHKDIHISCFGNLPLKHACYNENIEIIHLLLNDYKIDVLYNNDNLLLNMSTFGKLESLKALLSDSRFETIFNKSKCLEAATKNNQEKIINFLSSL